MFYNISNFHTVALRMNKFGKKSPINDVADTGMCLESLSLIKVQDIKANRVMHHIKSCNLVE